MPTRFYPCDILFYDTVKKLPVSGFILLFGQIFPGEMYRRCAVRNGGNDLAKRFLADIADRENAGQIGFGRFIGDDITGFVLRDSAL